MKMFSQTINQVLASLVLAILMLAGDVSGLRAHEIRPAIADLVFAADGTVRLDMSLILEAALAEIGAEHGDTDDSPNAARYDDLRLLDESALAAEFEKFRPRFLQGVKLTADGADVPLEVVGVVLDPVGDTDFARLSRLQLSGPLAGGREDRGLFIRSRPSVRASSGYRMRRANTAIPPISATAAPASRSRWQAGSR
jgi:hypothetical protein